MTIAHEHRFGTKGRDVTVSGQRVYVTPCEHAGCDVIEIGTQRAGVVAIVDSRGVLEALPR